MKTLKLLIPFVLFAVAAKAQLPANDFYERYVLPVSSQKAPAGYGLSAASPITIGAYADLTDQAKVNSLLNRFFNTFWWNDTAKVAYIDHTTKMINSVNYEIFRAVKPGTKDTISIYTDLYKTGPIYLPDGMTAYSKERLAAQFAPALQQLKSYEAAADKYADTAAKNTSFMLISFLQSNVGLDYLMDQDLIDPIMSNYGLDMDFKACLVRSYIFHKFEYIMTGQDNAKVKAFNAMVDDYIDITKKHAELATKDVTALMVKKS